MWPELTMLHARGQYGQLERMHRLFARSNFWLVAGIVALTTAGLPLIYGFWTARQLVLDPWTLGILSLRALLWGSWSTSMTLLLSINRQEPVAISLLGSAFVAGLLAYCLVPRWGISGAALALLIGDLCGPTWILPMLASREMKSDFWKFLLYRMGFPGMAVVLPAALALAAWLIVDSQIMRYLVILPLVGLVALASVWRQLEPLERRLTKESIQRATASARSVLSI